MGTLILILGGVVVWAMIKGNETPDSSRRTIPRSTSYGAEDQNKRTGRSIPKSTDYMKRK